MTDIKSLIIQNLIKNSEGSKAAVSGTIQKCLQTKYTNKVTVVGAGAVGMACAFCILSKGVSNNVVIIDTNENLVTGEVMDLQHGSLFLQNPRIRGGADYSLTNDSRICIVTAGVRQKEGESRLSLVQRNADIMKKIVPGLLKHSPETIILMVSNPVNVLTYVAWKLSNLPKHKVFGSGTNLDSARFREILSKKLEVSPMSCHAYIIGEHGDSSIPVWSSANVAGVRLRQIKPTSASAEDDEHLERIHSEVVEAAYKIIKFKGYTNWAVGLSVTDLVHSIIKDTANIREVTVSVKGYYGIEDDVFMSLPAVLKAKGVTGIVNPMLNETEKKQFIKSASLIKQITDGVKL